MIWPPYQEPLESQKMRNPWLGTSSAFTPWQIPLVTEVCLFRLQSSISLHSESVQNTKGRQVTTIRGPKPVA